MANLIEQRHQVHRRGRDRRASAGHRRGRPDEAPDQPVRGRYRHRHRARGAGKDLRTFLPGRWHHHAPVRRYRPGSGHLQAPAGVDGRAASGSKACPGRVRSFASTCPAEGQDQPMTTLLAAGDAAVACGYWWWTTTRPIGKSCSSSWKAGACGSTCAEGGEQALLRDGAGPRGRHAVRAGHSGHAHAEHGWLAIGAGRFKSSQSLADTRLMMLTSTYAAGTTTRARAGRHPALHQQADSPADLLRVISGVLADTARASNPAAIPKASPAPAALQGTVLLVEDNPVNQEVARAHADQAGPAD